MSTIFTPQEIEYARNIHRAKGKSFYFGTVFFPHELRDAVHVLYAFVRVPDDYVDTPEDPDERAVRSKITAWKEQWQRDYTRGESDDMVLNMGIKLFNAYKIPFQYSLDFLDAMIADTQKYRYASYGELDAYMWGSASVVGIMMTHICGYVGGHDTIDRAHMLGDAFQVTNFLRDIGEDYDTRARIYMPQDELALYGATEGIIRSHTVTPAFIEFMKFQIKRNRELYVQADKGIEHLVSARVRLGVRLARVLYAQILVKIEQNNYDVFNKRARTSFFEKLVLAIPVIVEWVITDAWRKVA